jgi:hypothetical protein
VLPLDQIIESKTSISPPTNTHYKYKLYLYEIFCQLNYFWLLSTVHSTSRYTHAVRYYRLCPWNKSGIKSKGYSPMCIPEPAELLFRFIYYYIWIANSLQQTHTTTRYLIKRTRNKIENKQIVYKTKKLEKVTIVRVDHTIKDLQSLPNIYKSCDLRQSRPSCQTETNKCETRPLVFSCYPLSPFYWRFSS